MVWSFKAQKGENEGLRGPFQGLSRFYAKEGFEHVQKVICGVLGQEMRLFEA